ncbi:glycosyltransferase [Tropicimonas sp.]|uniref:glycosyltransferase n=1 Tax=Tropicimonas sp. TaxID=2067044 RepID=UPI003A85B7A2
MLVAVGAITRRRPKMFGQLLESLAAMRRPEGVEIVFLLAENDTECSVATEVAAFRASVCEDVRFALEPTPGIPMGRNRVLDMALAAGADYLTFVDDDETVTGDWLVNLVRGMEAGRFDLAGAPVRLVAPEGGMTAWNRAVLTHLQARSESRNRIRRKAAAEGNDSELNIYTNNWCLRLEAQRRLGVRFDESLQFTGGSDTRFSLDMKAAGARIGWIHDAVVEEPTPQKRLTLGYHFRRARDQSVNGVRLNRKSRPLSLVQALLRSVDGMLYLLSVPVSGRYAVVKAVHKFGIAAGRIRGAFGGSSRHYAADAEAFHTEGQGGGSEAL